MEQSKFYQIKNITEQEYTLVGCDGSVITRPIQDVDKSASTFAIQDAKDGDILSYRNGQWIFIYKEKIDDNSFDYHLLYSTIHRDLTINDAGFTLLIDAITPATKEQRDLLFQKMKEAGYEWNADKKELKKFHVIDEGKAEMDYCFTKMMNGEKVSSAWSEEDEKNINFLCELLTDLQVKSTENEIKHGTNSCSEHYYNIKKWLKSLKERLQFYNTL